jgi:hypothetical protein
MIEDELRVLLARHEDLTPPVEVVAAAIDAGYRRRHRRRLAWRAGGAAVAVVGLLAVSAVAVNWRPFGGRPTLGEPGSTGSTSASAVAGVATAAPSAAPVAGAPLNVMLLGIDDASGGGDSAAMVMHVTASGERAYLLPVDAIVGDLHAAYQSGGTAGAGRAADRALTGHPGVRLDAAVSVTLSGLQRALTAMGGAEVCPGGDCAHYTGPDLLALLAGQPPSTSLSAALVALLKLASLDDQTFAKVTDGARTGDLVIDWGGSTAHAVSARLRGLRELVELNRPKSAAGELTQLRELSGAGADGYLASRAPSTGN